MVKKSVQFSDVTKPNALVNAKGSGNHQTLKVLEFLHENRDLLTSSAIARVISRKKDDNRIEIVKYGVSYRDSVILQTDKNPFGTRLYMGSSAERSTIKPA